MQNSQDSQAVSKSSSSQSAPLTEYEQWLYTSLHESLHPLAPHANSAQDHLPNQLCSQDNISSTSSTYMHPAQHASRSNKGALPGGAHSLQPQSQLSYKSPYPPYQGAPQCTTSISNPYHGKESILQPPSYTNMKAQEATTYTQSLESHGPGYCLQPIETQGNPTSLLPPRSSNKSGTPPQQLSVDYHNMPYNERRPSGHDTSKQVHQTREHWLSTVIHPENSERTRKSGTERGPNSTIQPEPDSDDDLFVSRGNTPYQDETDSMDRGRKIEKPRKPRKPRKQKRAMQSDIPSYPGLPQRKLIPKFPKSLGQQLAPNDGPIADTTSDLRKSIAGMAPPPFSQKGKPKRQKDKV